MFGHPSVTRLDNYIVDATDGRMAGYLGGGCVGMRPDIQYATIAISTVTTGKDQQSKAYHDGRDNVQPLHEQRYIDNSHRSSKAQQPTTTKTSTE